MTIELPAAPGRPARTMVLALRFCAVQIARPVRRKRNAEREALPSVTLALVPWKWTHRRARRSPTGGC